jgi:hypothetical protein
VILAILLAAATAVPATDDELVVIARKVDSITLNLGRDAEGHTTCGVSRSSGDVAIDAKLCTIAAKCIKPGPIDEAAVHACVDGKKRKLVAALAKQSQSEPALP